MGDSGGRRSTPAFLDRVKEMMYVCGPPSWASLFATSADLDAAARVLERPEAASPHAVVAARRLRSAVLHPDSLQPIPLPFRMAAHVPVNTALLLGMLTATSPLGTGAWQFANATFNALQFYANREQIFRRGVRFLYHSPAITCPPPPPPPFQEMRRTPSQTPS